MGRKVAIPAGGRVQYQHLNKSSYQFGYDTGTGPSQSFREETRHSNGTVQGRYGFIDPLGTLRIVDYIADSKGFRILSSLKLTAGPSPTVAPKPPTPTKPPTTKSTRKPLILPFLGPIPPFLPRRA